MKITIVDLTSLAAGVLLKNGLPAEDVKIIVNHLLEGELRGRTSHGMVRIPRIIKDFQKASISQITIAKETPISALFDGGSHSGLVVAEKAMEIAIAKAKEVGIGLVGGHNCTGIGMAGYFAEKAVKFDLIGLATANSSATLVPYGSSVCLLGTNPIAFALPGTKDFILTDFSTAKKTFGDVLVAGKLGQKLPEGILIDKDGNPSTNPGDVFDGAILPIADQKGSSLAVALEILAGPLVAAKAGLNAVKGSWGFLVGALNPEIFVSVETFKSDVQALIDEIRNSRPAQGFDEVLVPGERSQRIRKNNIENGCIEVPDEIIKELQGL